jgi:hypothetical protein
MSLLLETIASMRNLNVNDFTNYVGEIPLKSKNK